jgi:hypothetical protein
MQRLYKYNGITHVARNCPWLAWLSCMLRCWLLSVRWRSLLCYCRYFFFGLGVGSVHGAVLQFRGRVFLRSNLRIGSGFGAVADLLRGRLPPGVQSSAGPVCEFGAVPESEHALGDPSGESGAGYGCAPRSLAYGFGADSCTPRSRDNGFGVVRCTPRGLMQSANHLAHWLRLRCRQLHTSLAGQRLRCSPLHTSRLAAVS